jgi:hypothetical protein
MLVFCFGLKSWSEIHDEVKFHSIQIEDLAKDFRLPKKIFDQIEIDVHATSATLRPVYLFTPLQVILYSKGNNVIKNSPVKVSFPNGGGKIDLKDYLDQIGTFSLSFPKEQFEKMPTMDALYFISDAKQMEIEGEVFGLGCGKMVNLKNQFESLQKIDFLKLNTTAQRYIHVTTGFFVFVFRNSNQIYVSHLHVTDSRYPDHLCSSLYTK